MRTSADSLHHARWAAATRPNQENGDYLHHRTLTAIQYYIVHGENWL
ncbi:hypothetical protein [Nonomuraea glycinis]